MLYCTQRICHKQGCSGIGECAETGVRECSSLYYLKITLLFEIQIFWVDSVVTGLVSTTRRRGELVAQWRWCNSEDLYFQQMRWDNLKFRTLCLQNIKSRIWQSHVFGNAKLNNWKPCRANQIESTEEYTTTSFTIPLRKMNFSVVNRLHKIIKPCVVIHKSEYWKRSRSVLFAHYVFIPTTG
jgi:hypothetical protein